MAQYSTQAQSGVFYETNNSFHGIFHQTAQFAWRTGWIRWQLQQQTECRTSKSNQAWEKHTRGTDALVSAANRFLEWFVAESKHYPFDVAAPHLFSYTWPQTIHLLSFHWELKNTNHWWCEKCTEFDHPLHDNPALHDDLGLPVAPSLHHVTSHAQATILCGRPLKWWRPQGHFHSYMQA